MQAGPTHSTHLPAHFIGRTVARRGYDIQGSWQNPVKKVGVPPTEKPASFVSKFPVSKQHSVSNQAGLQHQAGMG